MYSNILKQTSYIFKHLSILRHEDDFDDSNLIYGPATPYIPGVSEPEPEIPLRDNEVTLNSTPKFNTPPVVPETSSSPSSDNFVSEDIRASIETSPMTSQTVTGNPPNI